MKRTIAALIATLALTACAPAPAPKDLVEDRHARTSDTKTSLVLQTVCLEGVEYYYHSTGHTRVLAPKYFVKRNGSAAGAHISLCLD